MRRTISAILILIPTAPTAASSSSFITTIDKTAPTPPPTSLPRLTNPATSCCLVPIPVTRRDRKHATVGRSERSFRRRAGVLTVTEMSSNGEGDTSLPLPLPLPLSFPDALGGGSIRPISTGADGGNTFAERSVPSYAVMIDDDSPESATKTRQLDEEGDHPPKCQMGDISTLVPGAFTLSNVLPPPTCTSLVSLTTNLGWENFTAGKNNHGAMQILVPQRTVDGLWDAMQSHVREMVRRSVGTPVHQKGWIPVGLNRRWRFYRYGSGSGESFAPHVDSGFPMAGLSEDGSAVLFDANGGDGDDVVSRYTVLLYLTDNFTGGHTKFYASIADEPDDPNVVLASVRPIAGMALLFPQAVGEDHLREARHTWPTHEGSRVSGGGTKVVVRTDVLFRRPTSPIQEEKGEEEEEEEEEENPLCRHDTAVRKTFLPTSPTISPTFLSAVSPLYQPHMGVENLGPVLYSLLRFLKARRVVEVGAGYTTPWILQALADNDEEMDRIGRLVAEGRCRLMDYPWCVEGSVEGYNEGRRRRRSELLCVDNCAHQKETASGAPKVARDLGIDQYLQFVRGDAFDMKFEPESNDVLWCDFGVGSRMADFVRGGAWASLRLGGYLVCHSTLTNLKTREWLEAVRSHDSAGEHLTGIPDGEVYAEISFLEPHKHYQNAISVIQKRGLKVGMMGGEREGGYAEPLYSEYA